MAKSKTKRKLKSNEVQNALRIVEETTAEKLTSKHKNRNRPMKKRP